ncbi:hypothetical protein B0T42_07220 [Rathayibacter sp. VKM Ac-2630]|nr:hypothetical protein B0T42_07220 [Rathayibacter sp. VKM Ac-2630]
MLSGPSTRTATTSSTTCRPADAHDRRVLRRAGSLGRRLRRDRWPPERSPRAGHQRLATGTGIPNLFAGTVVFSAWGGGLGWQVVVQRADGLRMGHSHLDAKGRPVGAFLEAGDVVGPIGDTGSFSRGTHDHVTASWSGDLSPAFAAVVDPRPYIREALGGDPGAGDPGGGDPYDPDPDDPALPGNLFVHPDGRLVLVSAGRGNLAIATDGHLFKAELGQGNVVRESDGRITRA